MTLDRDAERTIRAWLEPGDDRLPVRVRSAVLSEIASVPRAARAPETPVGRVSRRAWVGLAVGTVALAVALTGAALLRGQQSRVGGSEPTPTPSASAAGTPILPGRVPVEGAPVTLFLPDISEPPTPSASPTVPSTPIGTDGPLTPSRYRISQVVGAFSGTRWFAITVPAGWTLDGQRIVKHAGGDDEVALGWWVVGNVYHDPCHWTTSPVSPIDLFGHAHPDGGFSITEPPDAGLQGQLGRTRSPLRLTHVADTLTVVVELEVPASLAIATCDEGRYVRWTDKQSDSVVNDHALPGQVDEVYEVDMDRQPLTIDVSHGSAARAADLAEAQAILDSLMLEP